MAYEIPNDLIKNLQISLRNAAKISSYDPHDPAIPNLPSLHEAIVELDPSSPNLRCKHCNGRLLRDLKSFICVFCGREQNSEVPPDPINFKNTFTCRWLLESLELDGSEMVGHIDLKKSNQRKKSSEHFPLMDLLDLEIRWPESEKRSLSDEAPVPSKSAFNFAGVDLDYYFSKENKDSISKVFDESSESKTFEDDVDLSLFGNVLSSETATRITKHESGDSFSGWEANFQTSNSATTHDNSNSGELKETKNPSVSPSVTSDLFQQRDGSLSSSSSSHKIIRTPEQIDQIGTSINGRTVGTSDYSSSASVDWMSEENGKTGENYEAMKDSQAASGPSLKSDDVQTAMEKMHDLSFMVESHLSIPPK